jgi:hypothetical protein
MRLHQSWWRGQVLGVPWGCGPTPGSTVPYGNMLRLEDGERGLNFLTPAIFQLVRKRLAQQTSLPGGPRLVDVAPGRTVEARVPGLVEPFRLLCNLLSSQPMCFNLFGALALDLELATRVCAGWLPGRVARVRRVALEYAPEPAEAFLNDRTAFDALIEYDDPDGRPGFVGVETKLTEPFSQKQYDGVAYRRWMRLPGSPWKPGAGAEACQPRLNQLWRGHLLAMSMLRQSPATWKHGAYLLVHHPLDRKCAQTATMYRELLVPGEPAFVVEPLDALAGRLAALDLNPWTRDWLDLFRRRYLDLAGSAHLAA